MPSSLRKKITILEAYQGIEITETALQSTLAALLYMPDSDIKHLKETLIPNKDSRLVIYVSVSSIIQSSINNKKDIFNITDLCRICLYYIKNKHIIF
ncbi:hypothetical protein OAT97_00045 [Gammaproteobacteria bacterium]|nr:hypothetical protein [Gammaproteobacteria bacterium]